MIKAIFELDFKRRSKLLTLGQNLIFNQIQKEYEFTCSWFSSI